MTRTSLGILSCLLFTTRCSGSDAGGDVGGESAGADSPAGGVAMNGSGTANGAGGAIGIPSGGSSDPGAGGSAHGGGANGDGGSGVQGGGSARAGSSGASGGGAALRDSGTGSRDTGSASGGLKLSVAIGYSNMYKPSTAGSCHPIVLALPGGGTRTVSQDAVAPGTTGDGCNWPLVLQAKLNSTTPTATEIIVNASASGANTNVWYAGGDHDNATYQQMLHVFADARRNIEALGVTVQPGCAYIDLTYYIGPNARPVRNPTDATGQSDIKYDADISAALLGWIGADLNISCFRVASHTFGGIATPCTYGDPDCVNTQTRNESVVFEELLLRQESGTLSGIEWPVNSNSFSHALWPSGFESDGGHMLPDTVLDVATNYYRGLVGDAPHPPVLAIATGATSRTMTFSLTQTNGAGSMDYVDWYFGPGETWGSGASVTHMFAGSGGHKVQAFAHMNHAGGGEIGRASVTVNVP